MKTRHAVTAALLAAIVAGGCTTARPAEAMRDEGDRLFKRGDYEAAAAEYRQIVERYPGDWQAQYKLGLSLLELDQPTAAWSALEIAHTRRPNVVAVSDALAEAMYRDGQETELFQFLRLRVDETESTYAYLRLAMSSLRMADPASAEWAIDRAIERAGTRDVAPYLAAASLAERMGDHGDAVRRLRQAYGIDPGDERVASRLRDLGEVPGPTLALPPGL